MNVKQKTSVIQAAIALGDENGGDYKAVPHIGYVTKPVVINGWTFVPFEQDTSYKPERALFHLELVQTHFRVDQVFIAHEPEPERKKVEVPKLPSIKTESLVKVVTVLGSIALAGAMVIGYAAVAALSFVDPALIVTFEGEEDWMLCIAIWNVV
jgi:hypothetical protein